VADIVCGKPKVILKTPLRGGGLPPLLFRNYLTKLIRFAHNWNDGIMGSEIMQCWMNGKFVLALKLEMNKILLKSNLPVFHYSISYQMLTTDEDM